MTMKARMQTLVRQVVRGHTPYEDETMTRFGASAGAGMKACPNCSNPLHPDSSAAGNEHGLALYVCGVCGGSWILVARH
ncbi:zf-TFIIB domain-containing protein [Solimonas sp. SE-A11]|uniref:TFIIB-type zinc ribbon-containing protein n=1 Tax=Solimonas sp. SE-A11 TaxID=3054954 RepID=UPI00259C901E|nr:zf-TFIIB domain-containing protein [Solimonas sp. SE-A11]MDM4769020.1 zf-TFIIB domain-containing protein [Solimonas sp. SE-A11]